MSERIERLFQRMSLAQRFMLASVFILAFGMVTVGNFVAAQIADGVVHQTASTTALYVDSAVAPHVQELADGQPITAEHAAALTNLLRDTALGNHIVAFKIWDASGRIIFSTDPSAVGQIYPVQGGLARAWRGGVASHVSDLRDAENAAEHRHWPQLLETYSPVRLIGTNRIVAVAEFYQSVDELNAEMAAVRLRSWLLVGGITMAMYLLLAGFVQRAGETITRQQAALTTQVDQLIELLAQNAALHDRVRRAAARTTALTERLLRRVSAELHDGPAQALALALLRLDHVAGSPVAAARPPAGTPAGTASGGTITQGRPAADLAAGPAAGGSDLPENRDLEMIRTVLQNALREVRAISSGLTLPELEHLTVEMVVARVVRAHEQRSGTRVALHVEPLPQVASPSAKITLYRLLQEALTNAFRHAGGVGQRVSVRSDGEHLHVEVADSGPGFDVVRAARRDEHLGLPGMRERVESQGGLFFIDSAPGRGTVVSAFIPLGALPEPDAAVPPSPKLRRRRDLGSPSGSVPRPEQCSVDLVAAPHASRCDGQDTSHDSSSHRGRPSAVPARSGADIRW